MTEFWETNFKDKQEMWGWEPAGSAYACLELFQKHTFYKILIPGFGYGRNARIFTENGFHVTGIEIAETAIEIAKKHFGDQVKVYHGSVSSMPFNQQEYDGIFCYALIHLLSPGERIKLIQDCFNQLAPGGYMVFVTISKQDPRYGQGKQVSKDTFEAWPGLNLFFYDEDTIQSDFGNCGLVEAEIIEEQLKDFKDKPAQKFWYIVCKKEMDCPPGSGGF